MAQLTHGGFDVIPHARAHSRVGMMLTKVATYKNNIENGILILRIAGTNGKRKLVGRQVQLIDEHSPNGTKSTIKAHSTQMLFERNTVYCLTMTMQENEQIAELAQSHP